MNNNKNLVCCAVTLAVISGLTACGGGGGSSSDSQVREPSPGTIRGTVAGGTATDAIVRALRADTGEELQSTRSDEQGSFQVNLDYDGPVLLTAETDDQTHLTCDSLNGCGSYPSDAEPSDLNHNGLIDFGETFQPGPGHFQLYSFVPETGSSAQGEVAISPLTHTIWKLLDASGNLSPANARTVQSQVNNLLGLEADQSHPAVNILPSQRSVSDKNTIAHGVLSTAMSSWAYQQSEGFQAAIDHLANTIANNNLAGDETDPQKLSLTGLMRHAEAALERAADHHPGWPIADLIARFGIRHHIGSTHGKNPVTLPEPPQQFRDYIQNLLGKGKRLVSDLRSWANTLLLETERHEESYSERLKDLEALAKVVQQHEPLLDDAYRLFGKSSNQVFEQIWADLYPCLAAGAVALQANKVTLQPSICPTLSLTGGLVELKGQLLDDNGLVISDIEALTIEKLGTNNAGEQEFKFSGSFLDQNSDLTMTIESASWHYRLKPGHSSLSDNWEVARDQFEMTELKTQIVLADQLPADERTEYRGAWNLSLLTPSGQSPSLSSSADGILTSPNGTLTGIIRTDLTRRRLEKGETASSADRVGGTLAFDGVLQTRNGEIMTGTLEASSYDGNPKDDIRPISFNFLGTIQSLEGHTFDGSLRLKSDAPSYSQSEQTSDWWGWWHADQLTKSMASGIKLVDFSGKVTTALEEYWLLRAYLNIHNPGNLVSKDELKDWSFSTWGEMLNGTEDQYPLFSATVLFEEGIQGRDNSWISLSLDRTGFQEATAELRLSSNHLRDWRSMVLRYDRQEKSSSSSKEFFSFTNQNGALLRVEVDCRTRSDNPFTSCQNRLDSLRGVLTAEGQEVGQLKMLDNRLLKVSYSDGQFETIQ